MPPKESHLQRLWIFDFDGNLSPLVPDHTLADPMIPGVLVLENPAALVPEICRLAGLNADRQEVAL